MRKNNKKCTSKECFKTSVILNWLRSDSCSNWYHTNFVNIKLSVSKKIEWFLCPTNANVKYVNKDPFGDDLLLDSYVNTAISNVGVLKRVPKYSRVPLAECLLDNLSDVFYNEENVTYWLVFLMSFLFFL